MQHYQMFINNEWIAPRDYLDSVNPYNGEVWTRIGRGVSTDVDMAVTAAYDAFHMGPWKNYTASARGQILRRFGDLIAEKADYLAEIEVRDNGKLYSEMRIQCHNLPNIFYYYAGLADKIEGHVHRSKNRMHLIIIATSPLVSLHA